MNAYLFNSLSAVSQLRSSPGGHGPADSYQTWDGCQTLIVLAENPETAQSKFEAWLETQPEGENPIQIVVKKIAAAQFVDELFTESGVAPLDWLKVFKQWQALSESTAVDDFEQGYWVDVDGCVRPENLSSSVEALQGDLPEDIRNGLNWSADKQFIYILSVFSPPAVPNGDEDRAEPDDLHLADESDELLDAADVAEIQRLLALYPQAADKDAAAVIQARNSVVAAWLWRKYAADTRLAGHAIRIDPFCGVMGIRQEPGD